MTGEQTAWATQRRGRAYFTTSGGASWLPATRETFTSYAFADRQTGWAVDNARILHTSDGGKNWVSQVDASSQSLRVGRFINADEGWVGGEEGILLHTADGGGGW